MRKQWYRLDNAALIFPAVMRKNWNNVFRVSATLKEKVDPDILSRAAEELLPRFPTIFVRLRTGFFWYYLETVGEAPKAEEDYAWPLTPMTRRKLKKCCIRILYWQNRIAVEFFHSVTDGTGGMTFLQNLTEDQMRLSIDFLTDLDFIPAEEAAAAAPQTYTEPANIGAYNPDTGRIDVSLMTPILVQPEYLQEVLKVGEPIDLGYETITVETIESDEYYQYIINGQYQLKMQEDGLLRLYEFDAETMMEYSEQTPLVTEDTVFIDHIDPETLEALDEPVQYTFEEFLQRRELEATGVGPGFDFSNVTVTIDENGVLLQIDRNYTPWQ